ncbi:mitochondrial outer membrane translocase complex, subunit Tom22 [Phyllosticta citriasiana]|uniref:mitochondrial outer membrane translocase complex, subunit Tom22 n=1 Tax=Phyllosticta citriasiana TaxID=595635 RepID=UPI0030FDBAF1
MVRLEEVPDEELYATQRGPTDGGDDDWDDASSVSSDASSDISSIAPDETLYERVAALKDILPPAQRRFLSKSYDSVSSWLATGLSFSGKALWIVSSSALLLGVPFGLAALDEQNMLAMEQEMKMTQSANEVITPGAQIQQPGEARPAL